MKKVLWTVGLSNGETLTEEKGNFQTIAGELSPWQRLKQYVTEKGVEITSLSLCTKDGMRWNIPSAGKNPKFHAFSEVEKPIDFKMFRKAAMDMKGGEEQKEWQDVHSVIEAIYPDGRTLQVWVAEETLNSWTLMT